MKTLPRRMRQACRPTGASIASACLDGRDHARLAHRHSDSALWFVRPRRIVRRPRVARHQSEGVTIRLNAHWTGPAPAKVYEPTLRLADAASGRWYTGAGRYRRIRVCRGSVGEILVRWVLPSVDVILTVVLDVVAHSIHQWRLRPSFAIRLQPALDRLCTAAVRG